MIPTDQVEVAEGKLTPANKLEEYRLFIEDTARLSERRQRITSTYITVNSALAGVITFVIKDPQLSNWMMLIAVLPILVAGMIICYLWDHLITSYRVLINFRIKELEAMEQAIPGSHMMYNREASKLYNKSQPKESISFTGVERKLPLLFGILYLVVGLGLIIATTLVVIGILPP